MDAVYTSAPAKIILFGEHGVNRQQPALATAADLRTYCRVQPRGDAAYSLRGGGRVEEGDLAGLAAFRDKVDALREAGALDDIREVARDFFAPTRYVLAYALSEFDVGGVDVEWRSDLPIGSGLGSGAAANTSMVRALCELAGSECTREDIVEFAWQGDVIAHGGVASSSGQQHLDLWRPWCATPRRPAQNRCPSPRNCRSSSVIRACRTTPPPSTRMCAAGWTRSRCAWRSLATWATWCRRRPRRLASGDNAAVGHLMNIHQLFQEKMGTSIAENETLIEAALGAGALGAKISGSGRGGVIIALVDAG